MYVELRNWRHAQSITDGKLVYFFIINKIRFEAEMKDEPNLEMVVDKSP